MAPSHDLTDDDELATETMRPLGDRVGCLGCGFSYDGTEYDACPVCTDDEPEEGSA